METSVLRQEILSCLDATAWKRTIKVLEELQQKHGEDAVHAPGVYTTLLQLKHDGLVESQVQRVGLMRKYSEYRLRPGGKRTNVPPPRTSFRLRST